MDEFDLLAAKSKKSNQSNTFVCFWEKLADHKLLSRLTDLYAQGKIPSSKG